MGDPEYIVVLVALIVSLFALVVTTFQVSAQVFSTAEGQRKCSESLLSVWAKDPTTKARRKWRWSEARFELRFVTSEIYLGTSALPSQDEGKGAPKESRSRFWAFYRALLGAGRTPKRKTESILGADSGLDYVLFMSGLAYNAPDMVSWLSFLTFFRLEIGDGETDTNIEETLDTSSAEEEAPEGNCKLNIAPLEPSWPRVKYRVHSWDYMPPNAPKPFAKLSIHDIAVLVRRLGLAWKTFDPKNGNMSAEGGAHILTSSLIQGLGMVLEYRCLDDMSLSARVSRKVSVILSLKTNQFKQSQRNALKDAQADVFGLAPGDLRKPDEESQGASARSPGQQNDGGRRSQRTSLWVRAMDKLVFGVMPGDPRLGLPDYPFVEMSDRLKAVVSWKDPERREKLSKDPNLDWQCSFNDLMAIVPPLLKTPHTGESQGLPFTINRDKESVFALGSLLLFETLLRAFLEGGTKSHQSPFQSMREANPRLTEENIGETMLGKTGILQGRDDGGTAQMKRVLDDVNKVLQYIGNYPLSVLENLFHEYHDSTTQYFIEHKPYISLPRLISAFFSKAPLVAAEVRDNQSEGKYITDIRCFETDITFDYEDVRPARTLEHYFSYIPDYVAYMLRTGTPNKTFEPSSSTYRSSEDVIIEAWLTMMWRGYLFRHLHFYREVEGIYVPREYYQSRLPVYMI